MSVPFLDFGDEIIITHLGIWGQRSNTYPYTFTGCIGHYPNMKYRFTQIGNGSVYKDRFEDVIIKAEDCLVGHKSSIIEIDKITKKEKQK
jgi:hypothetical protein